MGVPMGGITGLVLPGNWEYESKLSKKPDVKSKVSIIDFLQWQFICRYDTYTTHEPRSLFWCHAVMHLHFTHVHYFACRSRLRNLLTDCSTVGLYCVSLARSQIFKGSLQDRVARLAISWPISKNLTIFKCVGHENIYLAIL